jgi:hypothetical protein
LEIENLYVQQIKILVMNFKYNKIKKYITIRPLILFVFSTFFFISHSKSQTTPTIDDSEKKVDYFEKIYFSGKNKVGINALYLATIQQLEGKSLSPVVAKQYALLVALKEQVFNAENACDALDIIAVGIYSIDANSAINQGIEAPTEKVKKKTFADVSSVLSGNVDSASKTYQLTAKAAEGKKIIDGVRSFFPKKDNPCKNVVPKDIQIGLHPVNTTTANNNISTGSIGESNITNTKITIKNIKYSQLSIIASRIEKIVGLINLNSDNYSNNIAILELTHHLKIKEIIDKLIKANKEYKIEVESISSDSAMLIMK